MSKQQVNVPKAQRGRLSRIFRSFFCIALLYPVIIALIANSTVQKHATFKHMWKFPYFVQYDAPEKYGLAPGKTLNINITTPDNCTLGAWFVLADPFYQTLRSTSPAQLSPLTESTILAVIAAHPTVLFLHGAGGTRAASFRVADYRTYAARLHTNVLALEYRGFGESSGDPSRAGLVRDAYAAWGWLRERGAAQEDVVLVGESLGTGVTAQLAKRLAEEGVRPRGIALLAPFASVAKLVEAYRLFRLPLLRPLQSFQWGIDLLKWMVHTEFDTLSAIQEFNAPTLIAHAQNDREIPYAHSKTLIDALVEPLLPELVAQVPAAPGEPMAAEELLALQKQKEERSAKRGEVVKTTHVPKFGMIEEFKGLRVPVVYVETFWGEHSDVGNQEGVVDEMAKLFRLGIYQSD